MKVITIEPDNYSQGANISKVSPYVTLGYWAGTTPPTTLPIIASLVPTNDAGVRYPAPTGNRVFGLTSGGGFAGGGCGGGPYGAGCQGFSMSFKQDVSRVSLLALNFGYPNGLPLQWAAWDAAGTLVENQVTASLSTGVPFWFDIRPTLPIRTLVIGGATGIGAICFDQLTFDISSTNPAPQAPSNVVLSET